MCGRFANIEKFDRLRAYYDAVANNEEWEANYNLAPTQMAPVVIEGEQGREIRPMKWGLVPHWAEDKKIGTSLINARSETVAKLPSFRDSFKTRRCIVPATGFYEWKKIGKERHPHYFTPADGLFSFCGLWSKWKSPEGETLETFTILTTTANDVVMPIHDRMPVALGHNSWSAWMGSSTNPDELQELLVPLQNDKMGVTAVSKYVNTPKNCGPECIAKLDSL